MFEILFYLYLTPYRVFKGTYEELQIATGTKNVKEEVQKLKDMNWITVEEVGSEERVATIMFTRRKESELLRMKNDATHHLIQKIRGR